MCRHIALGTGILAGHVTPVHRASGKRPILAVWRRSVLTGVIFADLRGESGHFLYNEQNIR